MLIIRIYLKEKKNYYHSFHKGIKMSKICATCTFKYRLNDKFPCNRCVNNEINKYKSNYEFQTSFGMFKFKLKNYYTE